MLTIETLHEFWKTDQDRQVTQDEISRKIEGSLTSENCYLPAEEQRDPGKYFKRCAYTIANLLETLKDKQLLSKENYDTFQKLIKTVEPSIIERGIGSILSFCSVKDADLQGIFNNCCTLLISGEESVASLSNFVFTLLEGGQGPHQSSAEYITEQLNEMITTPRPTQSHFFTEDGTHSSLQNPLSPMATSS